MPGSVRFLRMTTQQAPVLFAATLSTLLAAPAATADVDSFYEALHAQGITSAWGDQALFNAGTQVCKDTAFYIRTGGDDRLSVRERQNEPICPVQIDGYM